MQSFSDLALAVYCPRKLYYRRRDDDRDVPDLVDRRRRLAFEYPELLDEGVDASLLAVPPEAWRSNLQRVRNRDIWDAVTAPERRDVLLEGKDCRGIVHKVLDHDGPMPSVVVTGTAPENGVWEPDAVRAVAAAKALAWERETPVDRAVVEYPACGIVRAIDLTTRRRATYRRALRTARSIDGPPPRLRNSAKCEECEYRTECGVRTTTLGSLLEAATRR